ncbi:MAG: CDP-4-keto-6-deoxy-D-glucose-3-dehydrase [Candidatus Marinimicrobia bacterium]|mgnify:CR=1 FL=1|nr:CDP-4-keto-6-deoxy-D-glucose-3-dehydrase [Candidatus Neomarinimicrobiota bacterium]|tara:strand:+ start:90138 stop:91313 length:1176 start_codon:yes stop_codon:yes gene_type:complete
MDKSKYSWSLINNNISDNDKESLSNFILNSDRFTNGPKVRKFEEIWSRWLGVKHSVMVNSGAMANYLSIAVVKEYKGFEGEIIVPPIGWVSDISSVLNHGFIPVFSDVELGTLSLNYESVKDAVNDRTMGIVIVHCLGFDAISEKLIRFIKERNLIFIEDCSECHGAKHNNDKLGTFGDMSCFSFYYGHHMTTIEGGMVCTNDDSIYELLKLYRSHGLTREATDSLKKKFSQEYQTLNPLFTFAVPGYNIRSTEINAVLGLEQIKRLDSNIIQRRRNLTLWLDNLSPAKYFTDFKIKGNSSFALPLILLEKSETVFKNVQNVLQNEGVEFRVGTAGGGNQVLQPYLQNYKYKVVGKLNNANHIHHYGLYIGNHPELKEKQIINLCSKLNEC